MCFRRGDCSVEFLTLPEFVLSNARFRISLYLLRNNGGIVYLLAELLAGVDVARYAVRDVWAHFFRISLYLLNTCTLASA